MKKVLLVAAVVVVGLASCKKDYTCTCTTTGNGVTASVSSTTKATKKDAKSSCESGSKTANGYTTTCSIN